MKILIPCLLLLAFIVSIVDLSALFKQKRKPLPWLQEAYLLTPGGKDRVGIVGFIGAEFARIVRNGDGYKVCYAGEEIAFDGKTERNTSHHIEGNEGAASVNIRCDVKGNLSAVVKLFVGSQEVGCWCSPDFFKQCEAEK